MKPFTAERRKAHRARRIISIQFRRVSGGKDRPDHDWHLSTTYDMSALGLSFMSDVVFCVHDVLELNVVMSGILDIFQGFGKVVRVEHKAQNSLYLIAVEFVSHPGKKIQTPRSCHHA